MNLMVLGLVLISCVTHASWNLIAKRSLPTPAFFWISSLSIVVLASPVFVVWGAPHLSQAPSGMWLCLLATGVTQVFFYACLSAAYRTGDVSVVYPLSRANLLFIIPLAGVVQHQWPTSLAGAGIAMAVGGCVLLPRKTFDFQAEGIAWRSYMTGAGLWAIATALVSGIYTVIDAVGMNRIVRPVVPGFEGAVLYGYLEYVSITLCLTPLMIRDRFKDVRRIWSVQRARPCAVGTLDFVTYLLVLWAFSLATQISYVAAMRQFSTVLGVLGGILFFREPGGWVRLTGTLIVAMGLVLIALAR
jgi:drug/metabolite transporter (DMT)-like permease